ncbi:hypothetical protein DTO271D3_4566 [Paecilomyces variotii]|nr:hypothetical protein DTO271D3_4566 [Paecilomyces variotii]
MNDPASGLPGQLLPHMHLVSRYRYPMMSVLPTETAVDYLLSAPKIVRELQPMHWTFLDGPPDGTIMLTWQPLNHLGTNFASDGYVWADAEQAFTFEAKGYTVEMWLHRSGYHPPNENLATHCRRRFRLVAAKAPNPNLPPPDPSLWIVHYSKAPPTDHIPANRIPILPQTQSMLAQRRFLQGQGQLVRKDFMLHDRNNWPTINFPPQMGPQGFAQPPGAFPNAMMARQPGAFYPPQQAAGIPGAMAPAQAKAPRGHRGSTAALSAANVDFSLEDEEVSTGDMLDLLTPREIAKMRYQQHHEWMEEIFASPYATNQITPVDLGLGRKGELESLTAGFFDAPTGPSATKESKEAGKMEPGKAEEFSDRVSKKVADMTEEIEKLKKRHARRMEKFKRTSLLKDAELRLREAAADPDATGSELWRLEGRIDIPAEEGASPVDYPQAKPKYKVDDILREVETSWGKKIVPETKVACVEKGGLLDKIEHKQQPEPEGDVSMENTGSHVMDQFGTPGGSAPGQGAATQAGGNASSNVPNTANAQASTTGTSQGGLPSIPDLDVDIEMAGTSNEQQAPTADGETGDWVMVNDDTKKDDRSAGQGAPGSASQGFTPGNTGLETSNFDDAADFTNIDSAGDALAAYSEQHDGLDLPDLENSAFGDAFHASDNEHNHHHDVDDLS